MRRLLTAMAMAMAMVLGCVAGAHAQDDRATGSSAQVAEINAAWADATAVLIGDGSSDYLYHNVMHARRIAERLPEGAMFGWSNETISRAAERVWFDFQYHKMPEGIWLLGREIEALAAIGRVAEARLIANETMAFIRLAKETWNDCVPDAALGSIRAFHLRRAAQNAPQNFEPGTAESADRERSAKHASIYDCTNRLLAAYFSLRKRIGTSALPPSEVIEPKSNAPSRYRVGEIELDYLGWFGDRTALRERAAAYRSELADLDRRLNEGKAEDARRAEALAETEAALAKTLKRQTAAKAELARLRTPKGRQKSMASDVAHLREKLEELELRHEAYYGDGEALSPEERAQSEALTTEIASVKKMAQWLQKQIDDAISPEDRQRIAALERELPTLADEMIRLPLAVNSAQIDVDVRKGQVDKLEKQRAAVAASLAPLTTLLVKLQKQASAADDEALARKIELRADGVLAFSALRRTTPLLQNLRSLDDMIDRLEATRRKSCAAARRAVSVFVEENEASRQLDGAIIRAIYISALGQATTEVADMALNIGKDGPFIALGGLLFDVVVSHALNDPPIGTSDEAEIRRQVLGETSKRVFEWQAGTLGLAFDPIKETAVEASGAKRSFVLPILELDRLGREADMDAFILKALTESEPLVAGLETRAAALLKVNETIAENAANVFNAAARSAGGGDAFIKNALKGLSSSEGLKNAGAGIAQSLSKTYIKKLFVSVEDAAWYDFYVQEYRATQAFSALQVANRICWQDEDDVAAALEVRRRYIADADRSGQFKIAENSSFAREAEIEILVFGASPDDAKALEPLPGGAIKVELGGITAQADADRAAFTIPAGTLEWPEEAIPLALRPQAK